MHCNIKNNTIVVVVNNIATEYNLDELDSLGIAYNARDKNVHVMEKLTRKAIISTKKPKAVQNRTRGGVTDIYRSKGLKYLSSGVKKDANCLKRQMDHNIVTSYLRYMRRMDLEICVESLDNVKLPTFKVWCSIINRLLAGKVVQSKSVKLRNVARIIQKFHSDVISR